MKCFFPRRCLPSILTLALGLGLLLPRTAGAFGSKPSDPPPGADPCDQPHELPVVTHWRDTPNGDLGPGFEWGASSQFTRLIPTPLWGRYHPGTCYYAVNSDLLPQLDDYPASNYSIKRISNSDARAFVSQACKRTGVPVRLYRPDLQDHLEDRLRSSPGFVQVIHGMILDGAMVTLYLPPNWKAGDSGYPILASSLYDLNAYVFSDSGAITLDAVSRSGRDGKKGLIGILWNGGGAIGTRTINPRSRRQFDHIIQTVAARFGGDREAVMLYGASRGGMAALEAASNPDPHQYRVRFVYAAVPGVKIGSHARISPLTLPGLMGNFDYTTALTDAWRPGWRYPRCGFDRTLWGKPALEALLYISTGSSDPEIVDSEQSPISDRFVAELKRAGTELFIESGTHDFIIPFAHEAQYLRKLRANGIPVEASILVRSGHQPPLPRTWFWDRIWPAVERVLTPEAASLPLVNRGATHYYRVNRDEKRLDTFVPSEGEYPFTLEVPRVVYGGMGFQLILSGDPGTEYELTLLRPEGSPQLLNGVLPEVGHRVVEMGVPADTEAGRVDYLGLRIRRTGREWKNLDLSESTSVDRTPIFTEIRAGIPFRKGMEMTEIVSFERRVPGAKNVSWGVSEW